MSMKSFHCPRVEVVFVVALMSTVGGRARAQSVTVPQQGQKYSVGVFKGECRPPEPGRIPGSGSDYQKWQTDYTYSTFERFAAEGGPTGEGDPYYPEATRALAAKANFVQLGNNWITNFIGKTSSIQCNETYTLDPGIYLMRVYHFTQYYEYLSDPGGTTPPTLFYPWCASPLNFGDYSSDIDSFIGIPGFSNWKDSTSCYSEEDRIFTVVDDQTTCGMMDYSDPATQDYLNQYSSGVARGLPLDDNGEAGGNACGPSSLVMGINKLKKLGDPAGPFPDLLLYYSQTQLHEALDGSQNPMDWGKAQTIAQSLGWITDLVIAAPGQENPNDGNPVILDYIDSVLPDAMTQGSLVLASTKFSSRSWGWRGGGHVVLFTGKTIGIDPDDGTPYTKDFTVDDSAGDYFSTPAGGSAGHYGPGKCGRQGEYPYDFVRANLRNSRGALAIYPTPGADPREVLIIDHTGGAGNDFDFWVEGPSGQRTGWVNGAMVAEWSSAKANRDPLDDLDPDSHKQPVAPSDQWPRMILVDNADVGLSLHLHGGAAATQATFEMYSVQGGNLEANTVQSVLLGADQDALLNTGVSPVNNVPLAFGWGATVDENVATNIPLQASDFDGDALTYALVEPPAHGVVSISGSTVTYTPNANYSGSDSFRFKANDGHADSNIATEWLSVVAPPVAQDIRATVVDNATTDVDLQANDANGDRLTFTVISQPAHGSVSISNSTAIYAPDPNYHGSESFTYKANDGRADSNVATVFLDHAPVAQNISARTDVNTAITIQLQATDEDGDSLTYTVDSLPFWGTLTSIAGSTATYTPPAGYKGPDYFTFKANDGRADSNVATVSISVSSVNDNAPIAINGSATTPENTAIDVGLQASDVDGEMLKFTSVALPAHGTLSVSGSTAHYTPAANYRGTDSFSFKANDGWIDSNVATISLSVTDHAPIAQDGSATTGMHTAIEIPLEATDSDGDALTYRVVADPEYGTVVISGSTATYTPPDGYDYIGADSFTFKVNDGAADSNVATVSLIVDDAPIAQDGSATTDDIATNIALSATDVDGDPLSCSVVANPTHGTLRISGMTATYTPNANYSGPDNFTFKANDGQLDSNVATVSLTVVGCTPESDSDFCAARSPSCGAVTGTDSCGVSRTVDCGCGSGKLCSCLHTCEATVTCDVHTNCGINYSCIGGYCQRTSCGSGGGQ